MEKINIAEILRNSPKGTKLYSPIFGDVYLDKIRPHLAIVVTTDKEQGNFKEEFLYDGRYGMNGECMLFPSKENRDWNTFEISFNDGDIVASLDGSWIGITTGGCAGKLIPTYCVIKQNDIFKAYFDKKETWMFRRLATGEEKRKLFAAIKANGYKWNDETKTLEELTVPKFKVGDIVKSNRNTLFVYKIIKITDTHYTLEAIPGANTYDIFIYEDENWKLIPNKFDITTLKPFESKVLMRSSNAREWVATFYSHYNNNKFYGCGMCCDQCIPYEGNKHLLGTTNDCDDYYKTWE